MDKVAADKDNGVKSNNDKVTNEDSDEYEDLPEIECDVCNKKFSGPSSYELHISGSKHLKKLQALKIKKNIKRDDHPKDSSDQPKTNESEDDDDDFDKINCTLCKLSCKGYISYKQHLQSSKHLKNLKKEKVSNSLKDKPEVISKRKKRDTEDDDDEEYFTPYGHCEVCNKIFHAPEALNEHLEGNSHKKRVAQAKLKKDLKTDAEKSASTIKIVDSAEESDDDTLASKCYAECQTCDKKFSGPESLKTHIESDSHRKKIENEALNKKIQSKHEDKFEALEDGKYRCKECDKKFIDFIALVQHLKHNLHAKKNTKKNVAGSLENYPEITMMPLSGTDLVVEGSKDSSEELADFYVCKLCRRAFSGPECALQHVVGKKHKSAKKIRESLKKLPPTAKLSTPVKNGENKKQPDEKEDDFEVIG